MTYTDYRETREYFIHLTRPMIPMIFFFFFFGKSDFVYISYYYGIFYALNIRLSSVAFMNVCSRKEFCEMHRSTIAWVQLKHNTTRVLYFGDPAWFCREYRN